VAGQMPSRGMPRGVASASRHAGGRERRTPVVGHADGLAVAELGNRDVAVDSSVAVAGAPLDHDGVAKGVPPADPQP
jgi:hypothetical protein